MIGKSSNEDFLKIYLNILQELRENGKLFSKQNPELAPYLELSYRKSNDPETERLIESFAYMFAQVEHKSILAQNEYALNFIEHIFPELISPIPALTVLKIVPENLFFSDKKTNFLIPKSTGFLAKNKNDHDCYFNTSQDDFIFCLNILDSQFSELPKTQNGVKKESKTFVLYLETSVPLHIEPRNPLILKIYIDADFYSSVVIYDAIFSSKANISLIVDDSQEEIFLSHENIITCFDFENNDTNHNELYPLYDYLNYYQKYFFFKIKIDKKINIENKFKIVIPIEEDLNFLDKLGNNFFQLNCIPVVNVFEKKMEPIKFFQDKDEYYLRADGILEHEVEILNISSVKTYNSRTGEAFVLKHFQDNQSNFFENLNNPYRFFEWSTRKSFYDGTKENGDFYLKLLRVNRDQKDLFLCPDYLFPSGFCTQGNLANHIKPETAFYCNNSSLPVKVSFSLFWPKYFNRPLKNCKNTEVLKLLYKINQDLMSQKLLNELEFQKILDHLSSQANPLNLLLKQILSQSCGFVAEHTFSRRFWRKESYYVPGISYKLQFLKRNGYPRGIHFLLNFLNAYLNYIKDFNFCIYFEAILI